jgi:preprotein translocase SecE subunit
MAIVRTTTKDNGATESTPSRAVPTKPNSARPGGVGLSQRAQATRPGNAGTFIAETRAELNKVKWPTREEVQSGTIVTVGLLIFFAIYIFGADYIVGWLFEALGFTSTPSSPR